MKFPGSNSITLCANAIMQVLEKHINEEFGEPGHPIRVTWVKSHDNSFEFNITTDPKKEGEQ